MVTFDTSVWARACLNDHATQARKARAAIEAACREDGVFVPLLVLAELYWVLRCRWQKARVLDTLARLLETEGVVVESRAVAGKAVATARGNPSGLADLLIAQVAFANGAGAVVTFDKDFARLPGVRRLG